MIKLNLPADVSTVQYMGDCLMPPALKRLCLAEIRNDTDSDTSLGIA